MSAQKRHGAPGPKLSREERRRLIHEIANYSATAERRRKKSDPGTQAIDTFAKQASAEETQVQAPSKEAPALLPRASVPKTTMPVHDGPERLWERLAQIDLDPGHLDRNLIITATRRDPAHSTFDVLRTRLVQTLREHSWHRVAITSPTRDCGKTFTAVNLAISLSRYESCRTLLLDMDMRNPSVADVMGIDQPGSIGRYLRGEIPVEGQFRRIAPNAMNIGPRLAVAANDMIEEYAAEILQDPMATDVLDEAQDLLQPDVVLYDLPPTLAHDDVIASRAHFDGVLMIVGGGITKPEEVRESMRRLGDDTPLLAVILNQADGETPTAYSYY